MSIIIPIIAVTVIGIICGVMLVVASKFMAVPEDETFVAVRACLPGANCGACGYAGCDGYAHALADGEISETTLCVPGGVDAAAQVASALGLEAGEVVKKVAYVACCGDSYCVSKRHEYVGIKSCSAAELLFAGDTACPFNCLGYGDCVAACPFDAIHVVDGIAKVDREKCVGCGACAAACPNAVISIVPEHKRKPVVACQNKDKGADTRKACTAGCIGCMKCAKACPKEAITVENNLAHIDQDKCVGCQLCVKECPVGIIRVPAAL